MHLTFCNLPEHGSEEFSYFQSHVIYPFKLLFTKRVLGCGIFHSCFLTSNTKLFIFLRISS